MKRTNSLPLSRIVLTRPLLVQVLRSTVALNSYLGFSALYNFFFALCKKFNKGGDSSLKNFECNPNIRSNLWISLLSRNQRNTKRTRKIFLQLGRICFRVLSRQSENLSVFCKVFSQISFRDMMVPFYRYQWRQPARAQAPLPLPHAFFDTTNLHLKLLSQLSILYAESRLNASGIYPGPFISVRRSDDSVHVRKTASRERGM